MSSHSSNSENEENRDPREHEDNEADEFTRENDERYCREYLEDLDEKESELTPDPQDRCPVCKELFGEVTERIVHLHADHFACWPCIESWVYCDDDSVEVFMENGCPRCYDKLFYMTDDIDSGEVYKHSDLFERWRLENIGDRANYGLRPNDWIRDVWMSCMERLQTDNTRAVQQILTGYSVNPEHRFFIPDTHSFLLRKFGQKFLRDCVSWPAHWVDDWPCEVTYRGNHLGYRAVSGALCYVLPRFRDRFVSASTIFVKVKAAAIMYATQHGLEGTRVSAELAIDEHAWDYMAKTVKELRELAGFVH
jgi:hypothetical protein